MPFPTGLSIFGHVPQPRCLTPEEHHEAVEWNEKRHQEIHLISEYSSENHVHGKVTENEINPQSNPKRAVSKFYNRLFAF